MAYDDPNNTHDPTTSTVAPASWGDAVRTALEYLARNKPHCRVRRTTTQSITSATETAIAFDAERVDVGAMHSTAVNTSRITIPAGEGGWYDIGACCEWGTSSAGTRRLSLRVNGTTFIARDEKPSVSSAGERPAHCVSTRYQLAAGDYVEATVWQDSGGAINIASTGDFSPEFWATWEAV